MYKYTTILGAAICILLYVLLAIKTSDYSDATTLSFAVNEKLERYRDKYDREVAKRKVIETNNVNNFIRYQTTDSLLIELQTIVKGIKRELKHGGSATVFEGATNIDKSTVTNVFNSDSNTVYRTSFNDKWTNYNISASVDSIMLNLRIKNKYSVTVGRERVSLFKSIPYAKVTNYNPYSSVKDTRTYRIKLKTKKISIGPYVGYDISSDLTLKPSVGVGVQYIMIRL